MEDVSKLSFKKTPDEERIVVLLKAREDLLKEGKPITFPNLSGKTGLTINRIRSFLKKYPVYKHKMKVVPGKSGPKR